MNTFEFHIIGTDEVIDLGTSQYIPKRCETVWIDEQKYNVYHIETKFSKKTNNTCWIEKTIIYIEKYVD
jgi:hypothetical protein